MNITPNELKTITDSDYIDAFTGEPINGQTGIFQCKNCQAYYYESSLNFLIDNNQGRCIACSNTNIVSVSETIPLKVNINKTLTYVTLENYRKNVGKMVVFEGYVHSVLKSKHGETHAVMFENQTWTKGMKMIILSEHVQAVGGIEFINSLRSKTIKVQGLLNYIPKYGYQIVVATRYSILEIK